MVPQMQVEVEIPPCPPWLNPRLNQQPFDNFVSFVRNKPCLPNYRKRLRKIVMMIAFVKSMKNAPTIGTTRNARGAGP